MSPEGIGLIGIALLIILLFLGMPVALSMLATGLIGCMCLTNIGGGLSKLGIEAFASAKTYSLSVIPLFLFMGQFLSYSGLAKDIFNAVNAWLVKIRAGLALSAVGASALFGAVCGSIIGTAVTICSVSLPEMRSHKYRGSFAAACIAASAGLGVLIPPSTLLVLYGILTLEPIGKLLIAGIIPGVLMMVLIMLAVFIYAKIHPELTPMPIEHNPPLKERIKITAKILPVLILFVVVIGGIYLGVFSPTEGAAVGAFGAFIFSLLSRFSLKELINSLEDSIRITAMIFLIIIGANIFGTFMAMSKIPANIVDFVKNLQLNPYLIMGVIYIFYIILGMFMEGIAIMVLTVPIVFPLVQSLGFSGIWFGPIMVILLCIGTITPPVGIIVYIIAGQAKDIPMEEIFKYCIPLLVPMIVCLAILTVFPDLVTFLPTLMK